MRLLCLRALLVLVLPTVALVTLAWPGLAAAETLRIGVEADNAPFESVGPDGALHGFDIDLGNAMCRQAKVSCQWVNMDFDGMIAALNDHRIDAVMSEMSVTPERAGRVLFTEPVTRTGAVLVAADGSGISDDPKTLAGKTLAVQSGTTHERYARAKLAPATDVTVYQSQLQAFQDLTAGRADATLCDEGAAYDWIKRNPGYHMAGPPIEDPAIFGTGTAMALRQGDTADAAMMNAAFDALIKNGTYARINKAYFPFSVAPTPHA
jgi:lysine-arginine-ornithine-binding protein